MSDLESRVARLERRLDEPDLADLESRLEVRRRMERDPRSGVMLVRNATVVVDPGTGALLRLLPEDGAP